MSYIDTVVVGAGHAGLAVSRELTEAGRDHVVLERGEVAERWRTERWDSLHLLTPRWMTRLPGRHYRGPDPEGFMPVAELVGHLEDYASSFAAPVRTGTTVLHVTVQDHGYRVVTDQGTWRCRHVVVATGPWSRPYVPEAVGGASPRLHVTTASAYRNPSGLPDGGVLVVGASSSGVQIAEELAGSGRQVILSVGGHTRMPRRYRGMDIFWWLEQTGRLARTIDEVSDPAVARREPSMQLVGRPHDREENLDLGVLVRRGVRLAGRLTGIDGSRAAFADDLPESVAAAEHRMHRFLGTVDQHVDRTGLGAEVWDPQRPDPVPSVAAPSRLDLGREGVSTVLLATGYRPHHPWLEVPVAAPDGHIRQYRGVTPAAGLYVVGQRFQHRRDSGFIDGARHDAAAVVAHLTCDPSLDPSPR